MGNKESLPAGAAVKRDSHSGSHPASNKKGHVLRSVSVEKINPPFKTESNQLSPIAL